jgi:hypothetical protein
MMTKKRDSKRLKKTRDMARKIARAMKARQQSNGLYMGLSGLYPGRYEADPQQRYAT